VGDQRHAPVTTQYPLYRWLGGLQGRCGRVPKISPSTVLDLRTVQLVASRYTDWATPVQLYDLGILKIISIIVQIRKNS
jgi:hypothetical protein